MMPISRLSSDGVQAKFSSGPLESGDYLQYVVTVAASRISYARWRSPEMSLVKLGCCVVATGMLASAQQAAEKIDFFERRIRPVLGANCYTCHTDSKLGGLQVNSRV